MALVHGVGVSGYEQRQANNSELHCRTHPRTLAVAPIQEPTKFELSINMKTAKVLGLDVPWQLQQFADAVIE
jgi:hypothetical protein